MVETTGSMIVKNTITFLNAVTLNIGTFFQKSLVNACSAMGEQSNDTTIVLVYKARSHFFSQYILTSNEVE
jgi:hypothetical protein